MNSSLYHFFGAKIKSIVCGMLLLSVAISASAQDVAPDQAAKDELESIRAEFLQISQELKQAHQLAMDSSEVLANRESFNNTLKSEMLRLASETEKPAIEQRFEITQSLDRAAETDSSDQQAKVLELQSLVQSQQAVEAEAQKAESVKSSLNSLIASIQIAMANVNPKVPELMQRQKDLAQRAQAIQQRLKRGQ